MKLEIVIKLAPILILSIGALFLIIKKKSNAILLGVIGLLLLETIAYIEGENNKWVNYFSGPLYLITIHIAYKAIPCVFLSKKRYQSVLITILITTTIGLFIIHPINNNFVLHYVAIIELIVLFYPISFFLKLLQQKIDFNVKYFVFSAVIFLFFSLDIILYIMIKYLMDYKLNSFILLSYFRYIIIQLFYIFLIYFGWKLGKRQKV